MRVAKTIVLTDEQRATLTRWSRGRSTPARVVQRAKIVLAAAEGRENKDIAAELGCTRRTVGTWRNRFAEAGLAGIEKDAPRPGRTATVRSAKEAEIIRKTTRETPPDLDLIVDNYATHKHPAVKSWLKRHKRFHLHFIPTSSSWLNVIERWFRDITQNQLRNGVFKSVDQLKQALQEYIDHHNATPKSFVWTKKAEDILEKVTRATPH